MQIYVTGEVKANEMDTYVRALTVAYNRCSNDSENSNSLGTFVEKILNSGTQKYVTNNTELCPIRKVCTSNNFFF